jgi:tetratricopeptide (TPR) repeat protein/DNA-binding CsgD family transcriptional regulator
LALCFLFTDLSIYYMKYLNVLLFLTILFSCERTKIELDAKNEKLIESFYTSRSTNLHQTNPDSTLIIARKVNALADSLGDNTLKLESQIIVSYILNRKNLPKAALEELRKTLLLADELSDSGIISQTYQQIAQSYHELQQYDSTYYFLKKGLSFSEKINDSNIVAAINKGFGDLMRKKTQYDSSFHFYQKAINIYKYNKDVSNLAIVYNEISNVFAEQGLFNKAKYYLKLSIKINDSINNLYNLSSNYNNLGIIFKDEGIFDSAMTYFNNSIIIKKKLNNDFGVIIGTYNLANVYSLKGLYRKADSSFNIVYSFCVDNNFNPGVIKALSGMSENETRRKNYDKAKVYLEKALKLNEETNEISVQKELLSEMIQLHFLIDNDTSDIFIKYTALSDSIIKTRYLKEIADTETQHMVKLKDKSIETLNLNNKQKDYHIYILIISITFFILIALILYLLNKVSVNALKKENDLLHIKQKNQKLILQRTELNLKLKQQQIVSKALLTAENESDFNELANELYYFKNKLRSISDRKKYESLIYGFRKSNFKNPLGEFEIAFKAIYPDYINNLLSKHPDLTPREVQICTMIRLSLHTKQIAVLTNNSTKSIETIRSRIRKKMNLINHDNLTNKLNTI